MAYTSDISDKKLYEQWKYAVKHYGAKITNHGFGRWRLSLDPKKVYESAEFKEAQRKAKEIVECHNKN